MIWQNIEHLINNILTCFLFAFDNIFLKMIDIALVHSSLIFVTLSHKNIPQHTLK